jgi:hypothetical protein
LPLGVQELQIGGSGHDAGQRRRQGMDFAEIQPASPPNKGAKPLF